MKERKEGKKERTEKGKRKEHLNGIEKKGKGKGKKERKLKRDRKERERKRERKRKRKRKERDLKEGKERNTE
jgi:hypothetical protein